MQVSLTPDMQKFVEDRMKSGAYESPEQLVHSALLALRAQEAATAEDLADLRRMIAVGIEQLDSGNAAPWDAEDPKRRVPLSAISPVLRTDLPTLFGRGRCQPRRGDRP
jgi:antitoxin ParD1/3/4